LRVIRIAAEYSWSSNGMASRSKRSARSASVASSGAEFCVLGKPFPSRSASMRVRAYGDVEFTRGPGTPRFAGA